MTNLMQFTEDREKHRSTKWLKYAKKDILPMWVADADYRAPKPILDALQRRISHGALGYTKPAADLDQLTCEKLAETGWDVSPKWLIWMPGLVPSLYVAAQTLLDKDSDLSKQCILCPSPIYGPMLQSISRTTYLHTVPMVDVSTRPRVSPQTLREKIELDLKRGWSIKGFYFCNPHNPGGTVYTTDELTEIAKVLGDYDIPIVSDEVHFEILYEGREHRHIAANSHASPESITLLGCGKTYNIAGLTSSLAIIPDPDLRRRYKECANGLMPESSFLGMEAIRVAFSGACLDWRQEMMAVLSRNRWMIKDCLSQFPQYQYESPQGTFLAWLDLRELGMTKLRKFFETHGLGVSDGVEFGAAGFARINFATSPTRVEIACQRLENALKSV